MKRLILLFVLLFLIPILTYAQKKSKARIDSLVSEIQTGKKDTHIVRLLYNVSFLYQSINTDTGIFYARQLIDLSKKINYQRGIEWGYGGLAINYRNKSEFLKAIEYDSLAIILAKQLNDTAGLIAESGNIATEYYFKGDPENALEYAYKALDWAEAKKDTLTMANQLTTIATVYSDRGNYSTALNYFFKGLRLYEIKGKKDFMIAPLINIGNTYNYQGNYSKAIEYYNKCLDIIEESGGNLRVKSMVWGDMGSAYTSAHDSAKANKYLYKALVLADSIHNEYGVAGDLEEFGRLCKEYKNPGKAIRYYFKALKIDEELPSQSSAAINTGNIGTCYLDIVRSVEPNNDSLLYWANLKRAIHFLSKSVKSLNHIGYTEGSHVFLKNLSEAQALSGNYKKALNSFRKYSNIQDSLFKDRDKHPLLIELKYEQEKKEVEQEKIAYARQVEEENKIALTKEKSRQQNILTIVISLTVLIFAIAGVYAYRKIKEFTLEREVASAKQETIKVELEKKVSETKLRHEILEVQREALIAQLDAHFIAGSIDSIDTFIQDNEMDSASKYLMKFARIIRNALENSIGNKLVSLRSDLDITEDYCQLMKLRFSEGALIYNVIIDKELDPELTLVPPLIFQTLVENSIRHGFDYYKGTVTVEVHQAGDVVKCVVQDNGKGRSATKEKKSDRPSHGNRTAERLLKVWSDSGWATSFNIIDLFENGRPSGTRVEFTFPLQTD